MSAETTNQSTTNIEYINKIYQSADETIPTIIEMDLFTDAVSLQSSSAKKAAIQALIKSYTKPSTFILTGNVSVSITWFLSNQQHYENDSPPDVDNIMKPILDALCGIDGVMVDDTQIISVDCSWIDWERDDQKLHIEIDFVDDLNIYPKDGLVFIRFFKALCYYVSISHSPAADLLTSKRIEAMYNKYFTIRDKEKNYYAGIEIKPAQRLFHFSKINNRGFPVYEINDFYTHLESAIPDADKEKIKQQIEQQIKAIIGSTDEKEPT